MNDLITKIEQMQAEARDGMKRASRDSDPYLYQYMVGKFHAFGKVAGILKKQKEQKPAEWSEEDEEMLNSCISSIEESKENRYAYKETDGDTSYDREVDWLESLRNRVGKESLQSWKPSEEQMDVFDTAAFQKGVQEGRRLEKEK